MFSINFFNIIRILLSLVTVEGKPELEGKPEYGLEVAFE